MEYYSTTVEVANDNDLDRVLAIARSMPSYHRIYIDEVDFYDPNTGQPMQLDPRTGQPIPSAPGQPQVDPNTGQPLNPDGTPVVAATTREGFQGSLTGVELATALVLGAAAMITFRFMRR